jgi:hypothetical protein
MNLEMYASACLFCCSVIKKHRARAVVHISPLGFGLNANAPARQTESKASSDIARLNFFTASLAHKKAAARRARYIHYIALRGYCIFQ